jgi:hypothetical protein
LKNVKKIKKNYCDPVMMIKLSKKVKNESQKAHRSKTKKERFCLALICKKVFSGNPHFSTLFRIA